MIERKREREGEGQRKERKDTIYFTHRKDNFNKTEKKRIEGIVFFN